MLVGRAGALDRVLAAVDRRSAVALTGVPGIGATTLVGAVAERRPARVAHALPSLADRSHHPIGQVLGRSVEHLPSGEVAALVSAGMLPDEVLVVEDLQWSDPATIEVIEQLVGSIGMVVTVQTGAEGADRVLARLGPVVEELRLEPLDDRSMEHLLVELRPDLLPDERRTILRAAGGVPLVATTLAMSVDRAPGTTVPGILTIGALLARLPERARTTLAVLAVAPTPVPEQGLQLVDVLVDQGLVRRVDGRVELVHSLFGDPQVLPLDDDQQLAAWSHLAGCAEVSGTLRAEALLQVGEAAAALHEARRTADGPASRAEQCSGLRVAALASFELRRRGDDSAPDDAELVRLVVEAAAAANDTERHDVAGELVGLLGDLDGLDEAGGGRCAAAVEAVRAAVGSGDRQRAMELVGTYRHLLQDAPGPRGFWGASLVTLVDGWCSASQSFSAAAARGAEDWYERAIVAARRSDGPAAEFEASRNLVMIRTAFGHHDEARALAGDCIGLADELGEVGWSAEFRTLDVFSRFYDGIDQEEAIAFLASVRTAPVRMETRALATAVLATLLADRGAAQRSAEVLRPWTEPDRLEGLPPLSQGAIAWGVAQRAWIIGDLEEVERIGRWVTETVPEGYPSLAGIQVVWRWAEVESGRTPTAPVPRGAMLDCAEVEAGAIDLMVAGEHAAAEEQFLRAAESWRPILLRCAVRARWAAGHAAALAGRSERAVELLHSVDDELDATGCPALRPRVSASLRLAGVRTSEPRSQRRRVGAVTAREAEVLALVAEGCSSAEIGRRLAISASTVDGHVRSAVRTLGARGRVEAAAMVGLAGV